MFFICWLCLLSIYLYNFPIYLFIYLSYLSIYLGCVGALRENTGLLASYAIFLAVILLLEMTCGILGTTLYLSIYLLYIPQKPSTEIYLSVNSSTAFTFKFKFFFKEYNAVFGTQIHRVALSKPIYQSICSVWIFYSIYKPYIYLIIKSSIEYEPFILQ